jgi:hypothetical protein
MDEFNNTQTENSVMKDRGCTDCICCIIYVIFLGAFIFVFAFGLSKGNPANFATIFDSDSKQCGHADDGMADYPVGFLYQPLTGLKKAVCIKECPSWTGDTRVTELQCNVAGKSFVDAGITDCKYEGDFEFNKLPGEYNTYASEKLLIYESKQFFDKFCLPTGITASSALNWAKNITIAVEASEKFEEVFSDLKLLWKHFLILGVIAILLSIISLCLTRCCAGVFIWLIILAFLVLVFVGAVFAMKESNRLKEGQTDQINGDSSSNFVDNFSSNYLGSKNLYRISIFLYIFGAISILIVLFSLSSIAISIAVIKTASEFIASNCFIIFTPILISLLMLAFIFVWLVGLVYLWSVGELEAGGVTAFAKIRWDQKTKYFMVFYFFGFLWNVAFINYLTIFIVACTVAFWYFSYDRPEDKPRFPILKSFWWSLRFHLGSLAFGAFVLAVIQFIKFCLMFVASYVESLQKKGIQNQFVSWILKCMICCVQCFERFIKYMSSLGYAYLAISGKNFCSSCSNAFTLLVSNPMKFGMVAAMGTVFAFIGKLFVASLSGVTGYFLVKYMDTKIYGEVHSILWPVIFFVILGYFIASIFFSVYGVAADSVIICFFYSKENSTGYHSAPTSMQSFYDNYKKD